MKRDISCPVKKVDHDDKSCGKATYTADLDIEGLLYGRLYRSPVASGTVQSVVIPELPESYYCITADDIPGENIVKIIKDDQPIFADKEVNYIGEPILMVVGPDRKVLGDIIDKIDLTIDEKPACLTLQDAILNREKQTLVSYKFGITRNTFDDFENKAAQVIEETFESGLQEQLYLEPQAMVATYDEAEGVTVRGSMQCPYYVKNAIESTMAETPDRVRIIQETTGGAFGGKEDFPSMMGSHVAVAAKVSGHPVLLTFDRSEDMLYTTKRHPAYIEYKTCLDKDGMIEAMAITIYLDGGANEGLSSVVLQRALINCIGVYRIANISVEGYVLKTNNVPNGAFRGFGAPQGIAGIESHFTHIARRLGIDPVDFKKRYLVTEGDPTATAGCFHEPVLMDTMLDDLLKDKGYYELKEKFKSFNSTSSRYKKGIGTSLFLHGCGFTGSGERDHIKAVALLEKSADDVVSIRIANVDMGQGLFTTMSKIVAEVLDVDYRRINFPFPDTKYAPNSGPTVASRTVMIVGRLLERAAKRLKDEWVSGKAQQVEEHYVHIDQIPWDEEKFTGDAYPAYSWGINMVEVSVDTVSGMVSLESIDGLFDIGKAIDETIIKGQIDGGVIQGIGYGYLENMKTIDGRILQKSISDYGPPGAMDTVEIKSRLYDNPYANGPFGAKGAGELTLIGGAPAVKEAIEDALDLDFYEIPVTPEKIIERLYAK